MSTIPGSAAASSADPVEIAECLPSDPDAAGLLRAFHAEQLHRYGFADPAGLTSAEYTAPNGVFAVLCHSGVSVGCGGYRWFDEATGTVEIKRIYMVPASRGLGAGRALLSWLERHAVAAGARRTILETGVRNTAALGLFTSVGYRPVDRYVEGRDPAINRAFARLLTSES
jgi:GNAT superfamily N-acetyltransferase